MAETIDDFVASTDEYQRRLTKFASYIVDGMGTPDILGVQEVESLKVLEDLAAAIDALNPHARYEAYLVDDTVVLPVQVNGKRRDEIEVPLAMMLSLGTVMMLYTAVIFVTVGLLPDAELNMSSATSELRINDGGSYTALREIKTGTWYNVWLLVDNDADLVAVCPESVLGIPREPVSLHRDPDGSLRVRGNETGTDVTARIDAWTGSELDGMDLDALDEGIVVHDRNRHIFLFNRAAERITGVSRQRAIGQRCQEVFRASVCEARFSLDIRAIFSS